MFLFVFVFYHVTVWMGSNKLNWTELNVRFSNTINGSRRETEYNSHFVLGGSALAAQLSDSAYCDIFLRSVVCLSVVCHIHAPCVNRSTDLDDIRHVTCGSNDTLCIVCNGDIAPRKGKIGGRTPSQNQNMSNRQSYAATWRIQTRSWADSVSDFCQTTLVFLTVK